MKSDGYKGLDIYRLAHELGIRIHQFSLQLPKHELYEIGSQIRRASKSISSNIVEGYGRRRYKADFIRYLIFSQASCDETAEWLEYIKDCYETHVNKAQELLEKTIEIGKKLNRFIQSVEASHMTSK